ncbi:MAG: membrane dipeptidase, partial [Bacilli bacterium]|nr:membrane dipeptidase [Bacilli bacterium]
MFDTHYDLLTIAYKAYLTNDYSYLEKISHYFHENNVKGVFANLYFMSKEEMEKEVCPGYYKDDVSVLEMFQKSKEVLDAYLPDTEIIYSIEGADYIQDTDELEALREAGLDAVILCWNTENKYGSGNRSEKGLTNAGYGFVSKMIELGMGIDLSHANEKTFYDLCNLIEEKQLQGYDVCCYASHSNVRSLCDRNRNLSDEQLERIHEINGLVGVFAHRNFIVDKSLGYENTNSREMYLEHINYVKDIVGFSNVMTSTDDMDFCGWYDSEYYETSIYPYRTIGSELFSDLKKSFGVENASNI